MNTEDGPALLSVRDLCVNHGRVRAVQQVSFDVRAGESVGLVGESGSGKSTLARAILRLLPVSAGRLLWNGEDMLAWNRATLRAHRRELQVVFQDPLASLDPRMTVGEILREPLDIFEPHRSAAAKREAVAAALRRVGLEESFAGRRPHEFSGGQCQRIGIARAMMMSPRLLICDEPVSALDVSVQGQIVNLLADLQRTTGMAILFVSHNLAVVRHLCQRVVVIRAGSVVEQGTREQIFQAPGESYTRALLDAVPVVYSRSP